MAAAIARHRAQLAEAPQVSAEAALPIAYALGGMIDELLTQIYLRRDPALSALAGNDEAVADLLTELWRLGAYGHLPRSASSRTRSFVAQQVEAAIG